MTKTCLLDATVHILNISTFQNPDFHESWNKEDCQECREWLISTIGHDGSERGFHTQEIADALREEGIILVPHEVYPAMQYPKNGVMTAVPIYPVGEIEARFLPRLNRNNGVLVVRKGAVHHALSFQKGSNTAYDVARGEFLPLENLEVVRFLEFVNENNSVGQGTDPLDARE